MRLCGPDGMWVNLPYLIDYQYNTYTTSSYVKFFVQIFNYSILVLIS